MNTLNNRGLNNILLYSGKYDTKSIQPFVVNNDFYYLTRIDIPNLLIFLHRGGTLIVNMNIIDSFHSQDENNELLKERFTRVEFVDMKELLNIIGHRRVRSLSNISTLNLSLNIETHSLEKKLHKMRLIKRPYEKKKIRKACQITSEALIKTMKMIRPAMQIQSIVDYFRSELLKNGSREYSFLPIVSQNRNNSILHYDRRKNYIKRDAFVLMDVGGQYDHYCSDITRTFPISGSFTGPQEEVYSIVLRTLKYATGLVKPGLRWNVLTNKTKTFMYNECIKKNLFSDSSNINIMNLLMPHSLGHSVGLDNHDVGDLIVLKENMIIALEPGIYFKNDMFQNNGFNKDTLRRYIDMGGIRIEDTILVTKKGSRVLSNVPKEIKELTRMLSNE
jgi:Xaa-Pro aminopeptidase